MTLVDFFDDDELNDIQDRHERLAGLGVPSPAQKAKRNALESVLKVSGKGTKAINLVIPKNNGRETPPKVVKKW